MVLSKVILRFEKLIQNPVCLFRSLHKAPIPVTWEKPKIGWTKLNFDGSSKGKAGKASIGGLTNLSLKLGFQDMYSFRRRTNSQNTKYLTHATCMMAVCRKTFYNGAQAT